MIHLIYLRMLYPHITDIDVRLSEYVDALSNLVEKGVLNKNLEIEFPTPLFKDKLNTDKPFEIKKAQVWLNIWISENGIKYRDIDAAKINMLIRIFAAAELTQKSLEDLKSTLKNRITDPLKKVKAAYRSAYLKKIRESFGLSTLKEVGDLIASDDDFNFDLEKIVEETINNNILI